jgi:hypothetical protein
MRLRRDVPAPLPTSRAIRVQREFARTLAYGKVASPAKPRQAASGDTELIGLVVGQIYRKLSCIMEELSIFWTPISDAAMNRFLFRLAVEGALIRESPG